MPKVITSLVDGHYYPKFLKQEEVDEYQNLGYKPVEVSQEMVDNWKKHCKEVNDWHKVWMEIDNKIWEE